MKTGILFFLLISLNVYSQDVKEVIAKETCECIAKFDIDSMTSSDLELKYGLCMLESYNNYIGEFAENEKLDFLNNVQMVKFGEEIAVKMLIFCPDFILKLGESYDSSEKVEETEPVIKGVYYGSEIETFYTIFIKQSNGETTELVVLDYFDNVYLITDKLINNNEKLEVSYYEADLFDAKLNKFISAKIVTDIIKK
jgi:hypothetical protein